MSSDISLETFSEMLETVYAAALDPAHWQHFVRLVSQSTGSAFCGVGIGDARTMILDVVAEHGMPANYLELHQASVQLNPLLTHVALGKSGDFFVHTEIEPVDPLAPSPFNRTFMQPVGMHDSMTLIGLRSGVRLAMLVVNRAVWQPIYGPADTRLFRLLSPHVCRAFTISDAFDMQAIAGRALETTIDGLTAGVFLIDGVGRVVHMNRAASRQVELGTFVSKRDGRLSPVAKSSRDAFAAMLARGSGIRQIDAAMEPAIALLPAEGGEGGLIATFLPLETSGAADLRHEHARWAVFVQDPHVAVPLPGEAFARLYKLTPAELRIAMALAPGLSPEEVSEMLGVALPTVRTHIQHVFAKTNTNRQIDLVRLMMASMPPVAAKP